MMPDLRARLKAVAEKQQAAAPAAPASCLVAEAREPLLAFPGLREVGEAHARRLGLDLQGFTMDRALFLDTETTGLRGAGTVAFLVGLAWTEGDAFVLRQYLMRDYPEEEAVLSAVAEMLPRFGCAVTFNGLSFDMPLLKERFIMARMRERWVDLPQLDLLHAARGVWKLRLQSCSLSNLEREVLGVAREGDLPGAEVPERYFRYLKSGDLSLLEDVLRHNAQDLRSLGLLLSRLAKAYDAPALEPHLPDVFSLGRALDRRGEGVLARRCFEAVGASGQEQAAGTPRGKWAAQELFSDLPRQARAALAQSYRRERAYAEAAEAYRCLIRGGEAGPEAYIALAILMEWRLGDPGEALRVTEEALLRFAGDPLGRADGEALASMERRRERLRRKLKNKEE